ncbi:MAG: hypothetical protein HeimC3_32530 [Candidatus Heimdallarchaeota archaeon LC_3]|nr:MAG: hypothetical protein HeimC3_32530 [Candidatus Heimdallarchaeota archaeon LC_3]
MVQNRIYFELIKDYTASSHHNEFIGSIQIQNSVIRRLEIIGGVIKNIPNDLKSK